MKKSKVILLLILICVIIVNYGNSVYAQEGILVPSGLSKSKLQIAIEDYVEEHKDTTAAVAISVFNNKDDLYLGYHGFEDLENQVSISEDTVFEWGSISKLFIWVSVFQLWEQGLIDLDEDINTYLPENFIKKANNNEKITMLNLLHHDAGWQDIIAEVFVMDMKHVHDLKDILLKTEPEQIYSVGKYNAYSNWGAALAAYIVEEITGQQSLFENEETLNKLLTPTLYYGDTEYPRIANGFWFEILLVFINILIMIKKLLDFDILENIIPHIYLSFAFMITLLGYSAYLIFALRKTNIKAKKNIKYILSSIASILISFNIYYWQLYLLK